MSDKNLVIMEQAAGEDDQIESSKDSEPEDEDNGEDSVQASLDRK